MSFIVLTDTDTLTLKAGKVIVSLDNIMDVRAIAEGTQVRTLTSSYIVSETLQEVIDKINDVLTGKNTNTEPPIQL